MTSLVVAMVLFVGTHFLLSHPLRAPIVGAVGERVFLDMYSLVAVATIAWAGHAYGQTTGVQLWYAPEWLAMVGHLLMLIAAILFVGSFLAPNPALVMAGEQLSQITEAQGAMRITRHPMMWSFGLWGLVHIMLAGRADTLVFADGIAFLALVGAAAQDRKKRAQLGEAWDEYEARTSYFPRLRWPGIPPVLGGIALYAALVWLHPLVLGQSTRFGEMI